MRARTPHAHIAFVPSVLEERPCFRPPVRSWHAAAPFSPAVCKWKLNLHLRTEAIHPVCSTDLASFWNVTLANSGRQQHSLLDAAFLPRCECLGVQATVA